MICFSLMQQQPPQQFQAPRPLINRGPAPAQQSAPGQYPSPGQQPTSGQQQYPPINRAPVPQQAQIPQQQQQQQQRPPLIRAQIPPQSQAQPNPSNYPPVQRPSQPPPQQQQYNPNLSSDGQGIRVNQPNPPYRPQIQTQQRPINPNFNPNVQNRLPTHLEDRSGRMATEVNASNANQPSYLISNTDDVDDVIVRPISNVRTHIKNFREY